MAPIFAPTVTRIAETTLTRNPETDQFNTSAWLDKQHNTTHGETVIEFAGRSCYESFDRPSEATNTTGKYITRTVHEQQHYSILEHASVTYYLTGISRSLTHELVRHRHFGYSQQSQRFVNVADSNFVVPPAIINADHTTLMALELAQQGNASIYEALVEQLSEEAAARGETPREYRKAAREAARAVMPNQIETKIVITGNLRSWLEFVNKRNIPGADAEIRRLAQIIHEDLRTYAPNVFAPSAD